MRSDPRSLDGQHVDFVVVGGGIQGAAIARELAVRGCRPLLVERGDFACGTSMRSSRLVHGGVRYLERMQLTLVREALTERERLLRLAPHRVRPLPMLMPFFRGQGKAPWMLRLGLWLYARMAGGSTLPRPRHHAVDDCLRLFPGLRRRGLRGGSLYFDAATEDLPLTLDVLLAAAGAGARLCNHTELVAVDGGRVRLRDRISDSEVQLWAGAVVNVAGPHADAVRVRLGIDAAPLLRCSRGSHLVLPPVAVETALAAFLPDGRIQFAIPHRDGLLCGTTEVEEPAEGDAPGVPQADVDYLLRALAYLLESPPGPADVRFAYAGWRALPAGSGPAGALHREGYVVRERSAAGDVHTVVGGKLTTHRAFAERTAAALLGRRDPSPTREQALPGGDGAREPLDPLWRRYGSRADGVRALAAGDGGLLRPFLAGRDFLGIEVAYAARALGAVTFSDLMLRRLFHLQGPPLDDASLRAAYDLFARYRPAGLPPLPEFDDACAQLRAEVAAMRGAATAVDWAGSPVSPG